MSYLPDLVAKLEQLEKGEWFPTYSEIDQLIVDLGAYKGKNPHIQDFVDRLLDFRLSKLAGT